MTSPAEGAAGAGQVTGDGVQPGGGSSAPGQGPGSQQGNGQGGGNPAWAEFLKDIPQGLHGAVTPAFQKWDQAMTAKLGQVQQQFAPWQQFIDSGVQPDNVSGALELVQMIQQDPAQAISEMVQWAASQGADLSGLANGAGGGQGDGQLDPSAEEGEELPPWANELQQGHQQMQELVDLLAQKTIADGEQAEQEAAVDELESQLTPLLQQAKIAYQGEGADEDALDYIFGLLANGADPQTAVGRWTALQQKMTGQQASANAPRVLGAGGGLPTQQVDLSKPLSQADRRAMAVQRAKQMMAGG